MYTVNVWLKVFIDLTLLLSYYEKKDLILLINIDILDSLYLCFDFPERECCHFLLST